jgi:hypothetical protein
MVAIAILKDKLIQSCLERVSDVQCKTPESFVLQEAIKTVSDRKRERERLSGSSSPSDKSAGRKRQLVMPAASPKSSPEKDSGKKSPKKSPKKRGSAFDQLAAASKEALDAFKTKRSTWRSLISKHKCAQPGQRVLN